MMTHLPAPWLMLFTLSLVLMTGCGRAPVTPGRVIPEQAPVTMNRPGSSIPAESAQLLLVVGQPSPSTTVRIYAFDKNGDEWTPPFSPLEGMIGRNGFAEPGEKKEGDGMTPSGVYPLRRAFGSAPEIHTKLQYRQATTNDIWVDDPESLDYNRWVAKDRTDAASFEELRRKDGRYKYAVVIEYNTDPVVRGNGSAIFLHLWKKRGMPTSGCVAVAEEDLVRILEWLDPVRNPLIVMGTERTVATSTASPAISCCLP